MTQHCARTLRPLALAAAIAAGLLCPGFSAMAAPDAAQLDKLTPSGAQREGNADGSIPAWQGAEPPLAGWEWGKLRRDF